MLTWAVSGNILNHLAIGAGPPGQKGCVFVSTRICLQLLCNVELGGLCNMLSHLAIGASPLVSERMFIFEH